MWRHSLLKLRKIWLGLWSLGDTQAAVEAQRKLTSLSIENDRASQAKMQQERQKNRVSTATATRAATAATTDETPRP